MSAIRSIFVGLVATAALVVAGPIAAAADSAATTGASDTPMTINDTPWGCC